jgi:hypothetical protein
MDSSDVLDVKKFEDLLVALQDAVQGGQEKMPPAEQMQLYK